MDLSQILKKPYFLVLIILLLVLLIWAVSVSVKTPQQPAVTSPKNVQDLVQNLPINTFSLSGQVTSVTSDKIFFKAPVVVKTDQGNVVQYKEKTATVNDKTVISKTDPKTQKTTTLKLSDLKAGTQIVIYTSDNVFEQDNLSHVTKIDVK